MALAEPVIDARLARRRHREEHTLTALFGAKGSLDQIRSKAEQAGARWLERDEDEFGFLPANAPSCSSASGVHTTAGRAGLLRRLPWRRQIGPSGVVPGADRWLFPGRQAGRHIHPDHLRRRMLDLGLPSRAARLAALLQLAREVAQRAAERGEPPEQLVSEVLRRHFLLEVFERIWARNPHELTEEQALTLANEELDALRAERGNGHT